MKRCGTCGTTYTDDTLRYCLADGGNLSPVDGETETFERRRTAVPIDPPETQRIPAHPTLQASANGSGSVVKIVIAVLVVGFVGLIGLGAAGVIYYLNSGGERGSITTPTPAPSPSPSPTVPPANLNIPEEDLEDLEKELANLQRQLEDVLKPDQSNKSRPQADPGRPTATVNSPNDGFLALRSEPSAKSGTLIARIPHGSVINLENCEKEKVTIGGRSGRWCFVTYGDDQGWVFDAWLTY